MNFYKLLGFLDHTVGIGGNNLGAYWAVYNGGYFFNNRFKVLLYFFLTLLSVGLVALGLFSLGMHMVA